MGKLRVGIDIDEILRSKWIQSDKYFVQEFGEEGVPKEQPYVFDFFKYYQWEDTVEIIKELKEPDDMPENINPLDYQIDEKLGEAPADIFLFKKIQENKLTAKEIYNRFMYQDFLFEIHGAAPAMYNGMDLHVNNFLLKYKDSVDFVIVSKENQFSIPPTLFFLSKITSRFKNYSFVDNSNEKWKGIDILITTDPEILEKDSPWGKKIIKIKRPYNKNIKSCLLEVLQINDLTNNKEFEKIIKYKN